jgi:exosortase/archaeosortase family protein
MRGYLKIVIAVIVLESLSIALMGHKMAYYQPVTRLISLIAAVTGIILAIFLFRRRRRVAGPAPAVPATDPLPIRLLALGHRRITFPIYGVLLITGDVMYNAYFSAMPDLGGFDGAIIILGIIFLTYNFIPAKYSRERDFALLLFLFVLLLLVLPIILYTRATGMSFREGDNTFSYHLIVRPLSSILNFLGIRSEADMQNLTFYDHSGQPLTISIALSCAGIYSTAIFAAAFFAFVFVEYRRFDLKVAVLLVLGVITAYSANMLRMVILVILGYYNGMGSTDNPEFGTLLWAHAYLGWILFMIWITVFWAIMYRYLILPDIRPGEPQGSDAGEGETEEKDEREGGDQVGGPPGQDLGAVQGPEGEKVEGGQDKVDPEEVEDR